jgi:HAD domain in Swiss Army Knife RNA repair proteins
MLVSVQVPCDPFLPLEVHRRWFSTALLAASDPRTLPCLPVRELKTVPTSTPSEKPLLMVDIDGVISLFGLPGHARPIHPTGDSAARPGSAPPEGGLHSIDGIPHFLSATAAAHLLSLAEDFDLVWASGWEERANEHLPRLLGLPGGLPFLRFERSPGRSHAHWKLAAIDAYAGLRPLAWIDDAFNQACHEWAGERASPTLLVSTAPEEGLTAREAELLAAWARERSPA